MPSIWGELQGQIYPGSEAFIARIQSTLSTELALDEIPRLQRRPLAKPLASYREDFAGDTHTEMALAYGVLTSIVDVYGYSDYKQWVKTKRHFDLDDEAF